MNQHLINQIQSKIADYRASEIGPRTQHHIIAWANQFEPQLRDPLLAELAHVLDRTYFSKADIDAFLRGLVTSEKIAGNDPCGFWRSVCLLNIQQRGNSQRDMLAQFQAILWETCGFPGVVASEGASRFVYLDDAIFTGNHVRHDLELWVNQHAPPTAELLVIVVALHEGSYYQQGKLQEAISASGKRINTHWWRCVTLEDRKRYINQSDVLRPRVIPADLPVQQYAASLKYPVTFRTADGCGGNGIFSSEQGRHLLEQELLRKGVHIRSICPYLHESQRPLGFTSLEMLGFGSTVVTYRNCPNNCPLAFWAGDPWVPLFPRRTNETRVAGGFDL